MSDNSQSAIRNPQSAFVAGLAALAVAGAGQRLLDHRATLPALLGAGGLALGAILFAVVEWRARTPPPTGDLTAPPAESAPAGDDLDRARRTQAWLLAGLAGLVTALAIPGFVALAPTGGLAADATAANTPWLLWLAAVAVFLVGVLVAGRRTGPDPQQNSNGAGDRPSPGGRGAGGAGEMSAGPASPMGEIRPHPALSRRARVPSAISEELSPALTTLALLTILLIAAAFRFSDLDSVPRGLWVDEAVTGLNAQHILSNPAYRPIYLGGGNGEPAFYLYGIAGLIGLLGPTPLAVRLGMAVAGVAAVAALYWLARPLFGARVALVATALLAVMTWHVNFSRIAFNPVWSIPVDLLAAGCLFRGLGGRGRGWYLAAGVGCGLGFHLYYISRAWLLLMTLVVAYRLLTERGLWTRAREGLALAAVGALVTAAPILVYAAVEPADYFARAGSVSVFGAMSASGSLEPLLRSLANHLGMFNVQGDFNGRHNIPDARMLDPATAALLPMGLALAAWWSLRRRGPDAPPRWPYLFLLAAPFLLLAGGIFSSPDDSPQALRTLGVTTAVALLAALPVARLWAWGDSGLRILDFGFRISDFGRARPTSHPKSKIQNLKWPFGTALTLVLYTIIGGANYHRYFAVQVGHPQVWDKFATAQTLIAEAVNAHGAGTDIYTILGFYGHPTIQFLAHSQGGTLFHGLQDTPLPPPSAPDHDALLFLDRRNGQAVPWFQALYPQLTVEAPTAPGGGDPVLFALHIPAADLVGAYEQATAQPRYLTATHQPAVGLTGSYWPGATTDGPPALQRIDPQPSWWFWYNPIDTGTGPFTIVWEGTLIAPQTGDYTFATRSAGQAEIWLDGQPTLAVQSSVPQQEAILGHGTAHLAAGPHAIRLVIRAPGWLTPVFWYWTSPGGPQEIIPFTAFRPQR